MSKLYTIRRDIAIPKSTGDIQFVDGGDGGCRCGGSFSRPKPETPWLGGADHRLLQLEDLVQFSRQSEAQPF